MSDDVRPELAELRDRLARNQDAARPEAVARRRKTGQRTVRENLADLLDADSFVEYGGLAVAAQRQKLSEEQLVAASPADGIVTGIGTVNGASVVVLAYDYTVFAGTQGAMSHRKLDRALAVAERGKLPVILFAEGGGGRPNDTDVPWVAGLDTSSFLAFARLAGLVPRIGIVSGRCFAGNAALLGCCDVIIATENANIGMGGPAMIEGGGLGKFKPEDVGPIGVQSKNGVVDVRVADEAAAIAVARQYLGYFTQASPAWTCAEQSLLRDLVPERRRRAYKILPVIEALADSGSVLELRREFGLGITTALVRIEGKPFGVMANNPYHLGGAIDADAADKGARFLQLCDAFALPVLSLCDTPGFMVGPKAEETALVRHVARLFVTAASLRVPFFSVVLRKGYGLGAQAMAGGHTHAPFFCVAWPTGEFGAMGIEGAVQLGLRRELDAIADPAQKQALFDATVAQQYVRGKAMSMAAHLEIDAVIDPTETRSWLMRGLAAAGPIEKARRFLDTW